MSKVQLNKYFSNSDDSMSTVAGNENDEEFNGISKWQKDVKN